MLDERISERIFYPKGPKGPVSDQTAGYVGGAGVGAAILRVEMGAIE